MSTLKTIYDFMIQYQGILNVIAIIIAVAYLAWYCLNKKAEKKIGEENGNTSDTAGNNIDRDSDRASDDRDGENNN